MKITIDLNDLKSSDDGWSETTAKAVEQLTGRSFSKVISEAEEQSKKEVPKVDPSKLNRNEKLEFIAEYGREEFQKLFKK